jgi:hypothetical protein
MLYRSEIAVLDHNFNANSERQVMHSYWNFSKSTKQWVKKNVYVHYDDWRMHLVDTVVLYVKGEITIPAFRDSLRFPLDIPDNIYDTYTKTGRRFGRSKLLQIFQRVTW